MTVVYEIAWPWRFKTVIAVLEPVRKDIPSPSTVFFQGLTEPRLVLNIASDAIAVIFLSETSVTLFSVVGAPTADRGCACYNAPLKKP